MAANRIPKSLASNLALLLITDDVQDGMQDCLEQNLTHHEPKCHLYPR